MPAMRNLLAGLLAATLPLGATNAQAPTAVIPAPIPAAALRDDFGELYATLQRAHYNLYERTPEAAYDHAYRQMLGSIDRPMSPGDAAIMFQRFMALGRVAHARVDAASAPFRQHRAAGGLYFPLALKVRAGRAWVVDTRGVTNVTLESEIVAVDGIAFSRVRARLTKHISADTDYMMDSLLEYYFARVMWQEFGTKTAFRLTVRSQGRVRDIDVPALGSAAIEKASRSANRLSLDPTARIARMLDHKIAYLRPGPFYESAEGAPDPYDNRAFSAFIDRSFQDFQRSGARALVIDVRDNPGGDSSFSDRMIMWFASRPFRFASSFTIRVSPETIASNQERLSASNVADGGVSAKLARAYRGARTGAVVNFPIPAIAPRPALRFTAPVYLLINRASDSNSTFVAATIQDYGFGTIIGEETSDLASTLGAMEQFSLANSRIQVGYPKARLVRPNGRRTVRGVVPDILIPTPLVETSDDPVLERTVAVIEARLDHGQKAARRRKQ